MRSLDNKTQTSVAKKDRLVFIKMPACFFTAHKFVILRNQII